MEGDGDDPISSDRLFHDEGPATAGARSANVVRHLRSAVVDMIQIANHVCVQLESSDGRGRLHRMVESHARNSGCLNRK